MESTMADKCARNLTIAMGQIVFLCLAASGSPSPLAGAELERTTQAERIAQAEQKAADQEPGFDAGGWSTWTGKPWEPLFLRGFRMGSFSVLQDTTDAVVVPDVATEVVEDAPEPLPEPEVRVDEIEPTLLEAAVPISPWADLDLTLYTAATAPIPVGIPDSRRTERQAARVEATARFAVELTGKDSALWHRFLEERLRYGQDRPGAWSAAAELVVRLGSFELAPALATGLTQRADSLVRQVAHGALADLFGRHFTDLEDFTRFTEGLVPDGATLRLIEELRLERELSRTRLLGLFSYDLSAAIAHLDDVDPGIRLGAAQVLSTALRGGQASAEELLPVILQRFSIERRPAVSEVLLDAALEALAGRPAGGPLVEFLRTELGKVTRSQPDGEELLVARALARLPWPAADASDPTSIEAGVDLIAALLKVVTDPDVTLSILQSLDSLCVAHGSDLETAQRVGGMDVHSKLLALAFDDTAETAARVVAVGILPRVAPAASLLDLIRLASRNADSTPPAVELPVGLRFASMGAMGRFVERGDTQPEALSAWVTCLVQHVARPEADLRRRALVLLGNDALEPELSAIGMTRFITQLGVEKQLDLQAEFVRLIGRFGVPENLPYILALGNFDTLASRDLGLDASLSGLIERLAGGDPELVFEGAQRLWAVQKAEGQWTRREQALRLVAGLEPGAAEALPSEDHRTVANWAIQLREAGVSLGTTMPGGADFLQRLVDVHLPRSGSDQPYGLAEQNLMAALFLTDLAAARGNGEAARLKDEVLAKFARSEELAGAHPTPEFLYLVRRARARFLVASGTTPIPPAALADYTFVFDSEFRSLLDAADLRAAGQIAAATKQPSALAAAWRFGKALVSRPAWTAEPVAVRLEDLRRQQSRALASGDLASLRAAEALFEGLPASEVTADVAAGLAAPEGAAWDGLLGEPGVLDELRSLSASLSAASSLLVEVEEPEVQPAPEVGEGTPAPVEEPAPTPEAGPTSEAILVPMA